MTSVLEKNLLLVLVILLVILGLTTSQKHVCLREETTEESIKLICSVDRLGLDVRFFYPNGSVYGTCYAPVPDDNNVTCSSPYLTQNRQTNTTTLTMYKNIFENVYGTWMCTHGASNTAFIIVKPNVAQNEWKTVAISCLVIIGMLLFVYGLHWTGRITLPVKVSTSRPQLPNQLAVETLHLLGQENGNSKEGRESNADNCLHFSEQCHTCNGPAVCAVCIQCKHVYCEVCCAAHTKYYQEHSMCQVQHVYTTVSKIKCTECNTKTATEVCTKCIRVFCDPCVDLHDHPKVHMRMLNLDSTLSITRTISNEGTKEIKLKYKINVQMSSRTVEHPVRICGIAFLSDNRIVLADNFNNKLLIYEHKEANKNGTLVFEEDLSEEPRGLAAMSENKIAVTFAYEKEINIYEIISDHLRTVKSIKMNELRLHNLKPFAISYNDGWFAVEVGEGEDGKIVIVDEKNEVKHTISNKFNFAYFTGNTIRLALDKKKQRVFVSAMSRKTVSCVSFDGNVLWTFSVPSPRSLVLVPSLGEKNLILSSRRCGAIYRLNAEDATDDVLMAKGEIKSPRYIAYNEKEQLLCIQVATNDGGEDLLVYQYHPSVTSTL